MNKKFELEENHYENLHNVKMTCDNPLTKRKIHPPFANASFFSLLTGPPGSGKTTFLFNMLQKQTKETNIYYKVFKDIIYVCPKSSRSTIENNPLAELEPGAIFDEMSYEVQDKIIENKEKYDEKPEKHYNQLLILDDCSAYLKDKTTLKILSELSKNRRHLSLSIIILVQDLIDVPKTARRQISSLIMFKPSNNDDLETLRKEFVNMKKAEFQELANYVFKEKHDNLFVNRANNEIFKNLQRIKMN